MDLAIRTGMPLETQFPYSLGLANYGGICSSSGTKFNATRQSLYSSNDAKMI